MTTSAKRSREDDLSFDATVCNFLTNQCSSFHNQNTN